MASIASAKNIFLSALGFLARGGEAAGAASSLRILQDQRRSGITAGDRLSFSVAQKLQSQTMTLRSALNNAAQAGTIAETAAGGLSSVTGALERMRELAEFAGDGGITGDERAYANAEFQSLKSDIENTLASTSFDGDLLLGGATLSGIATDPLEMEFALAEAEDAVTLSIDSSGLQNVLPGSSGVLDSQAHAAAALAEVETALAAARELEAHANAVADSLDAAGAGIESRIGVLERTGREVEDFQRKAALGQLADAIRQLNGAASGAIQEQQVNNLFAHLLDIERPAPEEAKDAFAPDAAASGSAADSAASTSGGGAAGYAASSSGEGE